MDIKLRKWNEADLNSLVKYANNWNVAKWLTNGFPHPYTIEDGKAYLSMIANDNPMKVFAIEVGGEAVGSIGIFPQADIHEKSAEMGYWLAEECWGQGIMTKAIQEIVEYGFRTFGIVRIFARPFSTNLKSQRVLEKAGFRLEASLIKALYKNGEFMDELIYAKLKD
jgi:RimJ/RimL family protein N-acetyltransferase